MKIGIKKEVMVEAKTLKIYTKVTDRFCATLYDQDGEEIHGQEDGYVPNFMPGRHYGDYIILDIDIDTGQIKNWKQPTEEEINDFIGSES